MMVKRKKQEVIKSLSELGQTTFLEVVADYGSEFLKEEVSSFIGEIAIDTGASLIPGVSGAWQSHKRRRLERNMNLAIGEVINRIEQIEERLQMRTSEQQHKINELFGFILDYVSDEPQTDKIKYFINGFINLTEHESITEDFVLTYYDLMSELRMVDLAVLRLYCQGYYYDDETPRETFMDVMEGFGLTRTQYKSVQENLLRVGLLTTEKDKQSLKDLDTLFESIEMIHKYLKAIEKGKGRLPRLKEVKMKSKDRYRISPFGRSFYDFFLEEE